MKALRPLTQLERISVKSAAVTICRYDKRMHETYGAITPMVEMSISAYRSGVLVGVSIGSSEWWRDLPSVIERYRQLVGCEEIMRAYDAN